MKLAIDARALTTHPTGVGHYLLAAVNVWSEAEPGFEFMLLGHKPLHPAAAAALAQRSNVQYHCCPAPWLPGNGLWWLTTHFAQVAQERGAQVLWGPAGVLPPLRHYGMRTLLTVHDLVYLTLPGTMSLRSRIAYSLLSGRSIRQADSLWAVSNYTASEIKRHYPHRRAQDILVGSGLNPLRARRTLSEGDIATVRTKYGLTDRSILFVGTLEPRKNLRFLLSLMPALAARGYTLIVVGCSGWGHNNIADSLRAPDFPTGAVLFCNYVPDEELQALYQSAALFVSTSLMEGFGLPQLEAMAAGCPVVAAANSALIEVVGDGGLLVQGWAAKGWITAIESALSCRAELVANALARSRDQGMAQACSQISASWRDLEARPA